jgi:hypothetical protein
MAYGYIYIFLFCSYRLKFLSSAAMFMLEKRVMLAVKSGVAFVVLHDAGYEYHVDVFAQGKLLWNYVFSN